MFIPDVIDALLYAYGVWAPAAVIPIIYAVSKWYTPEKTNAILASSIIGSIVSLTWTILGNPLSLDAGVAGFIVALVVFFVVPKMEPTGKLRPLCMNNSQEN